MKREQILYYALKYRGEYFKIKKAIENKEHWEVCIYRGKYVSITDEEYPTCLKELKEPPFILFYEGRVDLLKEPMSALIGSRKMSGYGKGLCEFVVEHLHKGIVSGLASGVDGYCHFLGLLKGLPCIGVIGCGINVVYPKSNQLLYEQIKKVGLLISEYPNDVPPLAHHFPWRNRIIAALAKEVVVIEAKIKSGTMLTVNHALELGKEVYVLPHRIFDQMGEGCNFLLQQGANVLIIAEDIENL